MHSLQTLQIFGLDPASDGGPPRDPLVAEHGRWEHAGQRYFDGEVEPCINGRTIETGAYFGLDVAAIVERILGERLADGGWNCEVENGSVRSSFDTTINVLDGLLEFERATGGSAAVREARRGGEQYLLERGLFRRKSTGDVAVPAYLDFAFPYYWHYDVLRALDYFRRAGADPDPGMAEAVEKVRSKRQPDGRWLLDRIHPGRVQFDLEDGVGAPSRWNTLPALRVLDWWDVGAASGPTLQPRFLVHPRIDGARTKHQWREDAHDPPHGCERGDPELSGCASSYGLRMASMRFIRPFSTATLTAVVTAPPMSIRPPGDPLSQSARALEVREACKPTRKPATRSAPSSGRRATARLRRTWCR